MWRKQTWSNWCSISAFPWRGWGKSWRLPCIQFWSGNLTEFQVLLIYKSTVKNCAPLCIFVACLTFCLTVCWVHTVSYEGKFVMSLSISAGACWAVISKSVWKFMSLFFPVHYARSFSHTSLLNPCRPLDQIVMRWISPDL